MHNTNLYKEKDRELWENFLTGDDAAFAKIYETYIGELFSYGMRFTADRELVKDCIQDLFVKIHNHRKNLDPKGHIKFYLFISLKNTLFNVFCKDKNKVNIESVDSVFIIEYITDDRSAASEEEEERRERMRCILKELTPRQQEAIYYRYVEEMAMSEICRLMDMNYQSVQNLIQRSIKRVKKAFEGGDETEEAVDSVLNVSQFLNV